MGYSENQIRNIKFNHFICKKDGKESLWSTLTGIGCIAGNNHCRHDFGE